MSGNEEYKDFILQKFASLDVVTARKMFGGFVFHMAGKVLGFIFEDEFLFEPGPTVDKLLPDAERKELFPGSKLFVVIEDSISAQRLCELARECYDDFPVSKPRKKKGKTGKMSAKIEKQRKAELEERFPFSKYIKW